MMETTTRKYDIVVWGATGFTGKRLVEYLALNAEPGTRIALGGRSMAKLAEVKSRLEAKHPNAANSIADMDVLVGDSTSGCRMREVAALTKVVASTVGPYSAYGSDLVRACVEEKTDYCDIAGEIPWVRQMHRELNDRAVRNSVHIVSMCGFDCIPADLGCLMLAQYAKDELGEQLVHVKGSIVGIKGGVSGGTLASSVYFMRAKARELWRRQRACSRQGKKQEKKAAPRPVYSERSVIHYDETLQRWQTFWVMSMVNAQAACWAGRVLNYGPDFTYSESMTARSIVHAAGIAVGLAYAGLLVFFGLTRRLLLLLRVIPRPGEGPSESFTRKGFFALHLEGFTSAGGRVYGKVSGSSDPGYGETITYLGESALCLAFDRDQSFRPGVYPPSVAMGHALVARLRSKGCQFDAGRAVIPAQPKKTQ